MIKTSTISAKIKPTKAVKTWFLEQSQKAVELYNQCLNLQFSLANDGKKLYTAFDLAKHFRSYSLGSDYKDRIFERVAHSSVKWLHSEILRYNIYWAHKAENKISKFKNQQEFSQNYPYIKTVLSEIELRKEYQNHIKSLSRKQKISGRPRKRKSCSFAFSIRKTRQNTIQLKNTKVEFTLPKFKEKIIVGVDMGLKTTRTAVAINEVHREIVGIYQPERQRFFDLGYNALVWASNRDKRHLPFVHRKIARQRHDSIGKDIIKILNMGDIFKFGKPNSAFLLSGRLARSASDAANSMFLTRFVKRAELAGKEAGEVNESYTSVTCRNCSAQRPMSLHDRTYECFTCGHIKDRDINSAYQIAFRNFLSNDRNDNILCKKQNNQRKNGVLSRREMKLVASQQLGDFQA